MFSEDLSLFVSVLAMYKASEPHTHRRDSVSNSSDNTRQREPEPLCVYSTAFILWPQCEALPRIKLWTSRETMGISVGMGRYTGAKQQLHTHTRDQEIHTHTHVYVCENVIKKPVGLYN